MKQKLVLQQEGYLFINSNYMRVCKKHGSADVVTICMLILKYAMPYELSGQRFDSSTRQNRVNSVIEY